ncbi:MAG TPA: BON domain-containing protein [Acidobacteriaceae bacterium]|nr:BON domain-containing protein [Acidobacteriaceae bacterium]
MNRNRSFAVSSLTLMLAATLLLSLGCNKKPTDTQLTTQVQSQIAADAALQGQSITATVVNGVVTLSGTVSGQGSRELAGNDAAHVAGVTTVLNNLVAQDGSQPGNTGSSQPMGQNSNQPPQQSYSNSPAPGTQSYANSNGGGAPAPSAPQYFVLPAGTNISVQLDQTLSTKQSQIGETFTGTVAYPIMVHGQSVIRAGAQASGTVTDVKDIGHFAGQAVLAVRLDSVSADGRTYPVQTSTVERIEKGKGKRTAVLTGGGAGVGALLGGLFGGGKGALIGGALGAGAGGAGSAFTGNKDLVLPAETVLTFRLESDVTVR